MEPTTASPGHPRRERWVRALYFSLAALYAVPFWIVHYLPTVDGPCHTYNAWILRQAANPKGYPLFQQYYQINAAPYPNWIGHGVMALLMFVVPPLVAEKLLATGYVLTFLAGMWYLAGSVRPGNSGDRWLAFLAFPFVFNFLFQFGFYNFSISLALFPLVVGCWWRHRERPLSPGYAVGINLLLWLCYFSHVLSFALALLAIAVLWLATFLHDGLVAWRRHLAHVAVLAPQIALPIWYFSKEGGETVAAYWPLGKLVSYFFGIGAMSAFGEAQRWLAWGLAFTFFALLVLTLKREGLRRPLGGDRAFLLLAALFALLYFVSPEGMSGGSMLKNRLCLYPWLLLIPWLAPGFGAWARRAGIALLALVALLNLVYVARAYRTLSGEMAGYLAGLDGVRPGSRVLPLLFQHQGRGIEVDILGHAMSYRALERGLVDWDNYEATFDFFPVEFRAGVPKPPIVDIEARPGRLRMWQWKRRADYVYTWRMPPDHPLGIRLRNFYRPLSDVDGGVLWQRTENERAEDRPAP
jgi:hypothetical protein